MNKIFFLCYLILVSGITCGNLTSESGVKFRMRKDKQSHPIGSLWPFQLIFGLLGIILNSIVLRIFYLERHALVTSVNAMIWWDNKVLGMFWLSKIIARMDTIYRLLYSSFFVGWRTVLMSTDYKLFSWVMDGKTECLLMSTTITLCLTGSIIYHAATALIRYLYVKSSLQVNIQQVYKKDQFIVFSIVLTQTCQLIHVLNSLHFLANNGIDAYPFSLFRGCVDPWSFSNNDLALILPIDFGMVTGYNIVIILAHFYLFKFLKTQTDRNVSLDEIDRKKHRARNFVTVKTGFFAVAAFIVSQVVINCIYNIKNLDNASKAYGVAVHNDIYPCLVMPIALLIPRQTEGKYWRKLTGVMKKWNLEIKRSANYLKRA